ncbi:unnamed protein product [Calypogeia fissa]
MAKLGRRKRVQQQGGGRSEGGGGNKGRKRGKGESSSASGSGGDFGRDSFFERDGDDRKKKRRAAADEELLSSDDDYDEGLDGVLGSGKDSDEEEDVEEDEENAETADEKRLRVARAYLDKIRDSTALESDEDGAEETEEGKRGARDTLVADLLKQQQLEDSGRAQRKLASRVIKPSTEVEGKNVSRRHRQTVTAVTLTEDDSRGFSASKDGMLVHWDLESGQSVKYAWPTAEASTSGSGGGGGNSRSKTKKLGSKHILALAVSSDGRYLAAGGLDRTVHLWDTRTQEHIQAFPGHKGAISSLVFRQGTQQLMSGSFDRTIKLWSVDDRSYIDTLYGHQSEVLAIDCLRQERILSAGRDRTLRVWKVPEETQLVFRGHAASMDCCCFLSNGEFVSGSDDGSLAVWNTIRKKPVHLVKNAHGALSPPEISEDSSEDEKSEEDLGPDTVGNGHANGNGNIDKMPSLPGNLASGPGGAAESWIGAVAVCRGSDLVASGAGDGMVRLWALEDTNRSLRALGSLPVKGFVNSLAFAHSGRFILAGVGQEPRLGRWGRIPSLRNGVVQHTIGLSE